MSKSKIKGATLESIHFDEIVGDRMIRTMDSHNVSYSVGNRSTRRNALRRDKGDNKHSKQYHKQGH